MGVDFDEDDPVRMVGVLQQLAETTTRAELAERERDAYKKAKSENDDRFMLERDEARMEVEKLRRQLAEYEGAITWGTACLNCSHTLDAAIADHERADRAERALAAYLTDPGTGMISIPGPRRRSGRLPLKQFRVPPKR
jgi:hypothetical protein